MYPSFYRFRFEGSSEWFSSPHEDPVAAASHALLCHSGRHARRVREISPGCYRGLIGRRVSPVVYLAYSDSVAFLHWYDRFVRLGKCLG